MRALKIAVLLLVLGAGAAAVAFYRAYDLARTPYRGYTEEEIFFTVERGRGGASIADSLEELGVIRDRRLFILALRYLDRSGSLQAGEYRFSEPHSTFEVIERLTAGDIFTFAVTVPEGLTLEETAELLARQGLWEAAALRASFEDATPIAELDPDATSLEGYLYPTTYHFTRNVEPPEIARTMVAQFQKTFDPSRRSRARELDLTPRQVVTLASVIEKETGDPDERPLIGSVFWNRIERGMPLQSDPTVIYALKLQGRFDGNLRRADLELDSLYNTYRYPGIPPGPIASPGEASIDAVLEPESTSYVYFVSRNDGTHHFSSTYSEHLAAVRKFQVEFFRRKRGR
jgi:UPF0755 protein